MLWRALRGLILSWMRQITFKRGIFTTTPNNFEQQTVISFILSISGRTESFIIQFVLTNTFDITVFDYQFWPVESLKHFIFTYSVISICILASKIIKFTNYLFDSFIFVLYCQSFKKSLMCQYFVLWASFSVQSHLSTFKIYSRTRHWEIYKTIHENIVIFIKIIATNYQVHYQWRVRTSREAIGVWICCWDGGSSNGDCSAYKSVL